MSCCGLHLMDPVAAERQAILRGTAEAVARAFTGGLGLREDGSACLLREALLAESEDVSEAASARCSRIRMDLAAAAREAMRKRPTTETLVANGQGDALPVRVEVRGTAARSLLADTFTIGSAPECDVQAVGDATVAPLQCMVIRLPGGVIICDAWSHGGTREQFRGGERPEEPVLKPTCSTVFFMAYGERLTLRIGAKTTITLATVPRKTAMAASAKVASNLETKLMLGCDTQISTTCGSATFAGSLESCARDRSRSRARGSVSRRRGSSIV